MYLQRQSLNHVQKFSMKLIQRLSILKRKAMIDIASKQIIPAVIKYATVLANSISAVKAVGSADVSVQTEILEEVSALLSETKVALAKLTDVVE